MYRKKIYNFIPYYYLYHFITVLRKKTHHYDLYNKVDESLQENNTISTVESETPEFLSSFLKIQDEDSCSGLQHNESDVHEFFILSSPRSLLKIQHNELLLEDGSHRSDMEQSDDTLYHKICDRSHVLWEEVNRVMDESHIPWDYI